MKQYKIFRQKKTKNKLMLVYSPLIYLELLTETVSFGLGGASLLLLETTLLLETILLLKTMLLIETLLILVATLLLETILLLVVMLLLVAMLLLATLLLLKLNWLDAFEGGLLVVAVYK